MLREIKIHLYPYCVTLELENEPYRVILKNVTCIKFTVMHRRQEMLAIECIQIILTLWNNKPPPNSIHTHRTLHNFKFLFISTHLSPFPNLATENYNFCVSKSNDLQPGTFINNRSLMFQQRAVVTFHSQVLYAVLCFFIDSTKLI
jgi:hypothetical protein